MVATSAEEIRLQLRSWPEVEAYLQRCKGVIVPLGDGCWVGVRVR